MERDFGIFCQVGHLTIFQNLEPKNLELQILFTRKKFDILYTVGPPYQVAKYRPNMCVKKN